MKTPSSSPGGRAVGGAPAIGDEGGDDGDASASAGPRVAAGRSGPASGDAIADLEHVVIGAVGLTTRALEQAAPGVDLTFSQWRALLILGEAPDGFRVGEVAGRVGVTLPATSRMLRRLERRALVALAPDDADRRATRARLTRRGREVRDAIVAFRRSALREIAESAGAAGAGDDAGAGNAAGAGSDAAVAAIRALAASFDRYA